MDLDEILEHKCRYCGQALIPTFIDIGEDEPNFILGLTCNCEDWLELEMSRTLEYGGHN